VTAANGAALSARDLADVEVAPAIDASAAGAAARGVVAHEPEWGPPASVLPRLELFNRGLFDPGSFATRLAWFVEVRAGRSREFVWVDARGGVLFTSTSRPMRGVARSTTPATAGAFPARWSAPRVRHQRVTRASTTPTTTRATPTITT
jgi:hypothetical protein